MKTSNRQSLCAVLLCSLLRGVLGLLPPKTSLAVPFALAPKPTPPPALRRLKRDDPDETVLVAPDRTCGYISGLPGAPYTCQDTSVTCIFFTASSTLDGAVACCDDATCSARISCLDFDQISSASLCDDECMIDTFTTKCTESASRFCNTVSFSGNVFDYYCASTNVSTAREASTTYGGQDGRSFSEMTLTGSSTTRRSSSSSRSSTRSRSTPPPTSTGSSNATAQDDGSSSPPVGPIVGGVVGGMAVVGLAGLGILYYVRSQRAGKPPDQQQQQQPPTSGHLSYYSAADPNKPPDQRASYAVSPISPHETYYEVPGQGHYQQQHLSQQTVPQQAMSQQTMPQQTIPQQSFVGPQQGLPYGYNTDPNSHAR